MKRFKFSTPALPADADKQKEMQNLHAEAFRRALRRLRSRSSRRLF